MPYFFSRLFLVVLPLIVWQIVELFILPNNCFTFRPWESLKIQNGSLFKGPFYPNQNVAMWAAGDLNPRGVRSKFVRFQTDRSGYRNHGDYASDIKYDYLLVGDSNFAGANVDDSDTLRAVLENEYGKKAYTYASSYPPTKSFLNDDRITTNPPKFVVLDFRPEDVVFGRYATWPKGKPVNQSQTAKLGEPVSLWELFLFENTSVAFRIIYDRAHAQLGYNFLRARLKLAKRRQDPQLTVQEAEANYHAVIESMVTLRGRLQKQGTELIVLLMPLPYPAGVGDLVAQNLEDRVPMVHWQAGSPYAAEAMQESWYEPNDSHWRKSSIVCAAKRIVAASEGR